MRVFPGKLSQTKRKSQFSALTDAEVERFVPIVNEAFETKLDSSQVSSP